MNAESYMLCHCWSLFISSKWTSGPSLNCTLYIKHEIFSCPARTGGTFTANQKLFQHTLWTCVSPCETDLKKKKKTILGISLYQGLGCGLLSMLLCKTLILDTFLVSLILQKMLVSVIYFTPSIPKVTTVYFNERPKCLIIILLHCT